MESASGASGIVMSADGTPIAWSRRGSGPPLAIVGPLLAHRSSPATVVLADALSKNHTVYTYDRRGIGESGMGEEYTAESDVDDLLAVLQVAGGSTDLYGFDEGAFLALRAAEESTVVSRVVALEPTLSLADGEDELMVLQTEIEGLSGVSIPVLVMAGSSSGDDTQDLARQTAEALDSGEFLLVESDTRGIPDAALTDAIESFLA
ncbi:MULTISPECIES: alpha/beta fold hydrolase [Arthrobacter]|uniref:Alpha/beta fold hydrolase n=1 Tax=Arthrobacter jinronghuae TaxID=2964609 RepID=A0ABT1NKT3_9MICC|nr:MULTISPECIES: alpha/beta fold hydrolase [Arthrobacter]MCQ1948333.1 alpha/beta fold hydrolase [Arthrobacter jinronghuae]MCQ1951658.1 alpha/beta fold hydrolase [Arthrobacter sp. zg-Y238]MCQ1956218.1 alpha/beta fold hydrolase [Arthrobacter jinronghuae]UWX78827.1 alpha/beta fold hydrolase [Arthrobacter jinronghuae]